MFFTYFKDLYTSFANMCDFNLFWQFVAAEYMTIIGYVVLCSAIFFDHSVGALEKRHTLILSICCIAYSFLAYMDYDISIGTMNQYHSLRYFCATVCYMLRPTILAISVPTFISNSEIIHNKFYMLPLELNIVLYLINIPTGICFTIGDDNVFISGNLSFFNIAVCGIYFLILLVLTIMKIKGESPLTSFVMLLILSILTVCSVAEIKAHLVILCEAILVCLILYYVMIFVIRSNATMELKNKELDYQKDALMLSQIQPHFIYNTLNAIYYLCQVNPDQAGETILKFSDYLRQNLDISNSNKEMIKVEQELEHTRIYSDIEKLRFPRLKVEYDVNDGGYCLPPLTIEPLVENSIRHGVRGMDNGSVKVSLFMAGGMHKIVVEDNGIGMNAQPAADKDSSKRKGIGLNNVRERLDRICHGALEIESSQGQGTRITITLDPAYISEAAE